MGKGVIYSFTMRLILLCLCLLIGSYFYWNRQSGYDVLTTLLCSAISIFLFMKIIKSGRREQLKVHYLLEAIENDDFTFRFSQTKGSKASLEMNLILNQIKNLLFRYKVEIKNQERFFELILDKSQTGIILCNNQGHIYQRNSAALELLGLEVLTHLSQLKDKVTTFDIDELLKGASVTLSIQKSRVKREITLAASSFIKEKDTFIIITLNDISKQLDEKELESWIRITRVLTHEIMNSITPISSMSEYLVSERNSSEEELRKGLDIIRTTSNNLKHFVEHYRRFARIPQPQKECVDIEELLTQCRKMFLTTTKKEIQVYLDIDAHGQQLFVDKGQFIQAILHIMQNASEAIPNNGRIMLWGVYNRHKQMWEIGIENNGLPIPKRVQEEIFVPFFTTKERGSGVGLSVAKQIVRNHQGKLQLAHSREGSTLFLFSV